MQHDKHYASGCHILATGILESNSPAVTWLVLQLNHFPPECQKLWLIVSETMEHWCEVPDPSVHSTSLTWTFKWYTYDVWKVCMAESDFFRDFQWSGCHSCEINMAILLGWKHIL